MNTPLPPAPEPESKPHWPAPAAAAGAMAAGLMVGRKGAMGLALGVAAMAGARWLLARQREHEPHVVSPTPKKRPVELPELMAAPVQEVEPAVRVEAPLAVIEAPEYSAPMIIYKQPGEMPSCNAAPESSVWFALFNEAPLALHEAPPMDELSSTAPIDHAAENALSAEPLPESFFSEAPGIVESLEEDGSQNESKALTVVANSLEPSLTQEVLPKSIDEMDQPMDLFSRSAVRESTFPKEQVLPTSVLQRIVVRPQSEPAERVPRPVASASLPQKRTEGEAPKAWIVPAPEWQMTLQSKTNPGGVPPVHRAIVPHGVVAQAQATRRWPLVTAIMVVLFAAVALVLHGAGLDGSMIHEWKLHWKNFNPTATASDTRDTGARRKDRSKMASSPKLGE